MDWDGPAAVLSVSIGWGEHGYPFRVDQNGVGHSDHVLGVGTGLGISSTLHAARYSQQHPEAHWRAWTEASVVAEADGTRGGWQDAPGALLPGLKLITKEPGEPLQVELIDHHPLLDHLVLFDTGIRRNSGDIGDEVRALLTGNDKWSEDFRAALRSNVSAAHLISNTTEWAPWMCSTIVGKWQDLVRFVPSMGPSRLPPLSALSHGYKLLGAGGGGYGMHFARTPEMRQRLVAELRDAGFWATVPAVMDGYRWA